MTLKTFKVDKDNSEFLDELGWGEKGKIINEALRHYRNVSPPEAGGEGEQEEDSGRDEGNEKAEPATPAAEEDGDVWSLLAQERDGAAREDEEGGGTT